jgi:hypothetical protein
VIRRAVQVVAVVAGLAGAVCIGFILWLHLMMRAPICVADVPSPSLPSPIASGHLDDSGNDSIIVCR